MNKGRVEIQRLDAAAAAYKTEVGAFDAENVNYFTVQLARNHFSSGRAIQMGLGNGLVAKSLCEQFEEFVVVEGSDVVIADYTDRKAKYSVVKALFEEYTPEKKFDLLFGNHILEHVDHPVEILRQSRKWIRSGGAAMFTVPNAQSLHRRIGVEMGMLATLNTLNEQDVKLGHRRVYTIPELEADVIAAGYRIREVRGYMLKVVSNKQMKDWSRELLDSCYRVSLTLPSEMCSNLAIFCENP